MLDPSLAFSPVSGTGTWDLGREDSECREGLPGGGTRGRGTRGCQDMGLGDAGTWDSMARGRGTRGRDKQPPPKFCAEFAIYSFR